MGTLTGAQYYRDNPNNNITESESFKCKFKIIGKTPAAGNTKDTKRAKPLNYLSNFWRTLQMPLINWEISLILTWSEDCKVRDMNLYVPVVTLSTQDNAKLLEQLKSGFKRTISWNKYQPKVATERQNQYLDLLIKWSFQGVNRLFVLLFENEGDRKVSTIKN